MKNPFASLEGTPVWTISFEHVENLRTPELPISLKQLLIQGGLGLSTALLNKFIYPGSRLPSQQVRIFTDG